MNDPDDESEGKMFAVNESPGCPVQTVKSYLAHLNPLLDVLFQRQREQGSYKFKPE